MVMRKLSALLLAFGLMLGVAGSALANCGAEHTDTAKPTSQPQPQT
jgi:hypothetical protein